MENKLNPEPNREQCLNFTPSRTRRPTRHNPYLDAQPNDSHASYQSVAAHRIGSPFELVRLVERSPNDKSNRAPTLRKRATITS